MCRSNLTVVDGIDVIFLDAGGVLVVPDRARIAARFSAAGLPIDPDRCTEAHYRGVAALDRAEAEPEAFGDYHLAFASHLGHRDRLPEATAVLADIWATTGLWTEPLPGAASGLRALAQIAPIVIVSNADGTVADLLSATGLLQIGPGAGVAVAGIVDSGTVGVAKPDPAIFEIALEVVGATPDRALHVGDAFQYDVRGARSAGIRAVLLDPFGLRGDADCERAENLAAVARSLDGLAG